MDNRLVNDTKVADSSPRDWCAAHHAARCPPPNCAVSSTPTRPLALVLDLLANADPCILQRFPEIGRVQDQLRRRRAQAVDRFIGQRE
jgi:hypothetical protein